MDGMSADKYNPAAKWFGGLLLALVIAAYGGSVLLKGRAAIQGRNNAVLELSGLDATLFGICILSLAVAVHFFQFWNNTERLDAYANLGAGAALSAFVVTLAVLVARQFLNFI